MTSVTPQRLFLSDLHLENPHSQQFQRFAELLTAWRERDIEIYLLGDITELWIGDDDDSDLAQAFCRLLKETTARCPVHLMHGNRDFLYGVALAQATGIHVIADPTVLADGVLLAHGDSWCIDDVSYQTFRKHVRDPIWQQDILSQSLQNRREFGAALRAKSRETNANKAANIMDVNSAAVDAALVATNCHSIIHGHTHRPGIHPLPDGNRFVLGAWEDGIGWYAVQHGKAISLHRFSLAHRYEIAVPDRS